MGSLEITTYKFKVGLARRMCVVLLAQEIGGNLDLTRNVVRHSIS